MNSLSIILFLFGFFFALTSVIGILRLPDFYSRLHAIGKSDTLGVMLMLGGLALQQEISLNTFKILVLLLFIALANPLTTHVLGRAAWKAGVKPWKKEKNEN